MTTRALILRLTFLCSGIVAATACATTQPVVEQSADSIVTGRVGRRLMADPDVKRFEIDVDTIKGVVYLRGKVDSETMRASAERLARATDGVDSVVNELTVAPANDGDGDDDEAGEGDGAIKGRVGRALSADDDVRRVNIDVDVIDGIVTLSGIVHNEAEKSQAGRLAEASEGVLGVRNQLQVEQANHGDPEKLGKADEDGDRNTKNDAK